jgi:lysophospholipase L1-like esterase
VRSSRVARFPWYLWLVVAVVLVLVGGDLVRLDVVSAAPRSHRHRAPIFQRGTGMVQPTGAHWIATWGASAQAATALDLSANGFDDQTIRNIVFSSVGGSVVRVRLTNAFGTRPLEIGRAAIGVAGVGAGLVAGADRALSFAGQPSVEIPPGADALSDPVRLTVAPLQRLAVSIFLPDATGPATQHADAQQVNYVAAGARALDERASAFTIQTNSWYFVDGVDVLGPRADLGTVVALGDSITDGVGSPINVNRRWPNDLARRLHSQRRVTLGVIDEGIGGNRVLNNSRCCGVNALARFDSDAVDQSGAVEVILLEGINDIGFSEPRGWLSAPHTNVSAQQIIAGDQQIIDQAHAAGLQIFGGTLTPFKGAAYWTPAGEAKREAVNHWIRTSGAFDGVVDFARALGSPGNPEALRPAFDSGDHLHPNGAGYQAMANAVNLAMLLHRHGGT